MDDAVTAFLADVRMQAEDHHLVPEGMVLPLVAAVEAALRHHEPMPTYAHAEHADGSPACGHDADRPSHFEGDTGEMLCGESPGPPVCAWCEDNLLDPGEAEWPCPPYADITAALTGPQPGEGTGDGH